MKQTSRHNQTKICNNECCKIIKCVHQNVTSLLLRHVMRSSKDIYLFNDYNIFLCAIWTDSHHLSWVLSTGASRAPNELALIGIGDRGENNLILIY